ncbi:MAG TPA: hypothetical protein DDZ51_09465 [Planctomycetaceae bacterium]|nr:hypothetical protein [Planctomycetaceae bacterium]
MSKKYQLPTGDGASRDRVLDKMRKCTRKVARRWLREEHELIDSILRIRYRRAQELGMVDEQYEEHGKRGCAHLMDLLTCFGQKGLSYLRVMVYIDEQMFSDILEYNEGEQAGDYRITWDHVVALSECSEPESQRSILTQCMNARLSVERLIRLVDAAKTSNQKVEANKSHEVDNQPVTT